MLESCTELADFTAAFCSELNCTPFGVTALEVEGPLLMGDDLQGRINSYTTDEFGDMKVHVLGCFLDDLKLNLQVLLLACYFPSLPQIPHEALNHEGGRLSDRDS
jgi:hypothetical protein